jgi:mRNA-degrading endonuclease RelE of RelBE toxin-antitoxin system
MTNNNSHQISVRFANEFENELYRLSKKYRNIRADVEPIIAEIQNGIQPKSLQIIIVKRSVIIRLSLRQNRRIYWHRMS